MKPELCTYCFNQGLTRFDSFTDSIIPGKCPICRTRAQEALEKVGNSDEAMEVAIRAFNRALHEWKIKETAKRAMKKIGL